MASALAQFLREKKQKADEEGSNVDWQQRRAQWLQSVRRLYGTIEEWLGDLKADGTVGISYRTIAMSEDQVGAYEADCMCIQVGQDRIVLEPLGTVIVGANGRVDVKGSNGDVTLLEPDWDDWQIAVRTPRLSYLPLTEESFADVLEQIMAE